VLIDQQQGHRVSPDLQLPQSLQCAFTGLGGQDAEPAGLVAAEVTLDGVQHPRDVIHGHDDRVPHKIPASS
jgi:hypothetical protein